MKSQQQIEAELMRLRAEQAKADAEESRRLAAVRFFQTSSSFFPDH